MKHFISRFRTQKILKVAEHVYIHVLHHPTKLQAEVIPRKKLWQFEIQKIPRNVTNIGEKLSKSKIKKFETFRVCLFLVVFFTLFLMMQSKIRYL